MKHLLIPIVSLTLCLTASAKDFFVNTPKTTLMLAVDEGQVPSSLYFAGMGSHIRWGLKLQVRQVCQSSGLFSIPTPIG